MPDTHMTTHQLNDPDFDPPLIAPEDERKRSTLDQLPPKMLFIGGAITGLLVLCTIGFFILLSFMLRGSAAGR